MASGRVASTPRSQPHRVNCGPCSKKLQHGPDGISHRSDYGEKAAPCFKPRFGGHRTDAQAAIGMAQYAAVRPRNGRTSKHALAVDFDRSPDLVITIDAELECARHRAQVQRHVRDPLDNGKRLAWRNVVRGRKAQQMRLADALMPGVEARARNFPDLAQLSALS